MTTRQNKEFGRRIGPPEPQGLYHPDYEHDACGVGAICNLRGEKSHDLIHKALEILVNLTHRGATLGDHKTGDGAGVLVQMPDAFMRQAATDIKVTLPEEEAYASGLVFLPRDKEQRNFCKNLFEEATKAEGQDFLGWRPVPVDTASIGDIARASEPVTEQIFIGRSAGLETARDFERILYVIRKVVEKAVRESDLTEKTYFYTPSLSCKTMIYKGLLLADQIEPYFPDLTHPDFVSALALVHQRYSTNTFPTWDLAQPFRFLCHNGEINTLRGNANWMNARQYMFKSEKFGKSIEKLFPIAIPGASDSAILDNGLELLYHSGRSLPHAMMMMIPEAWQNHQTMPDNKKAFYEYHACMMEPWDGPASIPFTDGTQMGAVLDRNGLRPSRYTVTKDGFVIMGSETGVVEVEPNNVEFKGRLEPGRMFLVDMEAGRIIDDQEIKEEVANRQPYRAWLNKSLVRFKDLDDPAEIPTTDFSDIVERQQVHGYSQEDLKIVLRPMAMDGKEALGSMGDDTPIAVLSERPRLLYDYFRQLFAQVTNPPIDPFRERIVTSMRTTVGAEHDLFQETDMHCHQFALPSPLLTNEQLAQIKEIKIDDIRSATIPILFEAAKGGEGLKDAMTKLREKAAQAVRDGASIIILSDRDMSSTMAPIPALLAVAGLHHYLIREGIRTKCGIVVESGEPREVHHFCCLFAYGAGAVNPYLAYETMDLMSLKGILKKGLDLNTAIKHYIQSITDGILKVISKMGISTLHSYRGAQILEAVGLSQALVDEYFTWTPSRIEGIDLDILAEETLRRHRYAYGERRADAELELEVGGKYQWRRNGEYHALNPHTIAKLQIATKNQDKALYREYADLINNSKQPGNLRNLMAFNRQRDPVPLDEVEPWTEIVKRFKTGAMSYGSISKEAHEALAIAMNRLGGKSNSGEGGEDSDRFIRDEDGDWRMSKIKQAASGRFGVTSNYLANAEELQIKMAQGAKPGEGGELPGFKVYPWIANTRHTTPWVGLISPPPHHDIYSIEDLAQLIHDLKNANPEARVNVKLVSEVGVGTVAAGVSKGKADVVLISGFDGGTGAAKQTSIKSCGLPWELGLAETHQTLVLNDLRSRIVVECDGGLRTGRDVAIATLLGAEEYGFSSTPLVAMGCIMMRVCHLNTCPVGIATQDPELRKKFEGSPDSVVQYFHFVAEEIREIMAELGFRTINEMVGQTDCLEMKAEKDHWKAKGLNFSKILTKVEAPDHVGLYCTQKQDHGLDRALDNQLIELAQSVIDGGEPITADLHLRNINRTVGTMLSYHISKKYGEAGLPDDSITFNCTGSAGQSFCAFGAKGITMNIQGDANDYFGKGLSGAKLIIRPPVESTIVPEDNIVIGNVAFFGAVTGEAYIRGKAGERFCVRNSGVHAVVEGVGDHACEYMTGGRTVILGPTGRNFAAGMSGGIAYIWDEAGDFLEHRLNRDMVDVEDMTDSDDISELHHMIENHVNFTGSTVGQAILDDWNDSYPKFIKIMPTDYKRAMALMAKEEAESKTLAAEDEAFE